MKKCTTIITTVMALGLATSASAQVNLTAETASPSSAPGVSVIALSEAAAKYNVANMQVTTGQTLTNSVQNVAEGKSDVAAAPFVLPFLLSRAVGPYAKVGKEKGAELASQLAVLYTYRIACQGLYAYDSNNFPGYDGIKDALGCQGRQDLGLELLQIFEAAMAWARSCLGMLDPPCETFSSLGNSSLKHSLTSRVRSFYLHHLGTLDPCLIPLGTGPDHFHFKIVLPHLDVPCHMVRHMRIRGAVIW
jgi:hypothetical protein